MADVYWLHLPNHTDIQTHGYVGITNGAKGNRTTLTERVGTHFIKMRHGSHPNPKLQNAYNKYGDQIVSQVVFSGSIEECALKEYELRPQENIGWNVKEGGGVPPIQTGKHWYTNGKENKLCFVCPDGWREGKTQISGPEHGHYSKPKNYEVIYSKEFINQQRKGKRK